MTVHPLFLLLGAGGAYLTYKAVKKPAGAQAVTVQTATGVPVHVVTPVPAAVTAPQAHATPVKPPIPAATATVSIPHVTTVTGTVYAPPASVTEVTPGVVQSAPVVITPTGASSVAISTTQDVQKALNALGYQPRLAEDNQLGPLTVANIKAFQSASGITVDGNAGPVTKAKLSETLAKLASSGPVAAAVQQAANAITSGSGAVLNATVVTSKDVQHALNLLGAAPPLDEDGVLGPKSVAAIKTFQLSHGLVPDGVAGPVTKTGLSAALLAKGVAMHGDFMGMHGAYSDYIPMPGWA